MTTLGNNMRENYTSECEQEHITQYNVTDKVSRMK